MTRLKSHYITNAQKNTAEALSMAMQLWHVPHNLCDTKGIPELVQIINSTAISLRNLAQRYEYDITKTGETK